MLWLERTVAEGFAMRASHNIENEWKGHISGSRIK